MLMTSNVAYFLFLNASQNVIMWNWKMCENRRKFLENNSILLHYFILLQMNSNVYSCLVKTLKITLLDLECWPFIKSQVSFQILYGHLSGRRSTELKKKLKRWKLFPFSFSGTSLTCDQEWNLWFQLMVCWTHICSCIQTCVSI